MRLIIGLAAVSAIVIGCAHHRDVRAGADGVHSVVVKTEDTEQGSRNAIRQANHFCEQRGKSAAFVKEDSKYTGSVDEETYNNVKTASKVAKTVGSAASVFGGKKESEIGGLAILGGVAGDSAMGKGYTVDMKFKCM